MKGHLYFVCPTDYLERVIDNENYQENYFCTSLGNSMTFDSNIVGQITKLLETRNITEITFILSDNNRIILDALGDQEFSMIRGLTKFYNQLLRQKEYAEECWQTCNQQHLLLSYHLNKKIKELSLELRWLLEKSVEINGMVYNQQNNAFTKIYSDLICTEYLRLN